jgi:hypothetical protein
MRTGSVPGDNTGIGRVIAPICVLALQQAMPVNSGECPEKEHRMLVMSL